MSDEREDHQRLQLEANARAYANALREAQPKAEASQQHLDKMLTWAIGLMGAALFYLPNLLEQACPAGIHPRARLDCCTLGARYSPRSQRPRCGGAPPRCGLHRLLPKMARDRRFTPCGRPRPRPPRQACAGHHERPRREHRQARGPIQESRQMDRLLLLLHARCLCSRGGRRFAGDRAMLATISARKSTDQT
jgi:hypothetical protein